MKMKVLNPEIKDYNPKNEGCESSTKAPSVFFHGHFEAIAKWS